jgi:hypothetical protein
MGRKITIAVGALVALGLAAGGFYWMRARGERALPLPDVVSPEPPGFEEAVLGDAQATPELARPAAKTKAKKKALPAEAALPLKTGEVLNYTADVAKLDSVATLTLKVAGQGSFLGKSVWHLQATAHTLKPLRVVFELDDQFDSYSDARTLESLQYEMRLNERGQKVQSIQRMTPTGRDPAKAGTTEARVVPGTRDPLGMMQYLRTVNWKETSEASSPVYDGHKLYEVRAKLANPSAVVGVPAGVYRTTKIEIHVFENGVESKDASFALYLANDAARTPVLLEAVMPIATARVALVKEEQQSHDARR